MISWYEYRQLTEREEIMETDANKLIALYKKMLDIAAKEQKEIAGNNLDKIERYCSLKIDIIREIDEINNGESLICCSEKNDELESLIKQIIIINKANAEALSKKRNEIMSELSTVRRRKTAFRAYETCA
ncbi:MAG TPA: hypothetical protein ENH24_00975 [Nitrospirae bacterium]|nr:hypothetical protein [Nitrospirota bacterium]